MLAVIAACAILAAPLDAAEHWFQYRGPNGDGHSAAKGLPVTWSETNNVKWKTPIHGRGWSSPVVWDKLIWLTTSARRWPAYAR